MKRRVHPRPDLFRQALGRPTSIRQADAIELVAERMFIDEVDQSTTKFRLAHASRWGSTGHIEDDPSKADTAKVTAPKGAVNRIVEPLVKWPAGARHVNPLS